MKKHEKFKSILNKDEDRFSYFGIFILTALIVVLFIGCVYTDYCVIYPISQFSETFNGRNATEDEINLIEGAIKKVADDFGFSEIQNEKWNYGNFISLYKNHDIKSDYDELLGSDSSITIVFYKFPSEIEINITDGLNRSETDFIKQLKSNLEMELSKLIDMESVKSLRGSPLR